MLTSLVLGGLLGLATAQFPPEPEGITVLKSKLHENVTISFKEPGICETTPGVRSYSGYVHLPPGFLSDGTGEAQDYPINTFFWFFEARKDPSNAPLAIWLNGGPGGSSLMGLLEELGPCSIASDSKTTVLNPYSWNNEVNLLFLDQPTQVGFSYDVPTNGTLVRTTDGEEEIISGDFSIDIPQSNLTHQVGTFASQKLAQTANGTAFAAHALWHFAQTWFFEFPHYKPNDDRVSLWAESYGGHYGPGIFRFFQQQNDKIAEGTAEDGAQYLHLDTLGIVNGLMDMVIQEEAYITWPYNNTYGLEIFDKPLYEELMYNWTHPGGFRDQALACEAALKERDSGLSHPGKNVSEICGGLALEWGDGPITYYHTFNRGWYDIAHPKNDPFPAKHMLGYLTQESVLAALGVPVNFTSSSSAVATQFINTFDIVHGGFLDAIGYLLDSGVKVHMMYGDRDYACNWVGGEKASLAVPYSRITEFADTGYSPLLTPDGISGMTRQLGNYSFTRVFQAGHEVPSYQPVAAYEIFMRATFNKDIPTGLLAAGDNFQTIGPKDTWHIKNIPPVMPKPQCYVLSPGTCTPEVWETVVNGSATVKDWYVVDGSAGVEDQEGFSILGGDEL
ncbi:lysosomal protective protein precursor [Aspergillus eucalypticola CBS 122712]|uniref:Lysosomal protective protein n=1 Tax=Aspergillus eucalypticola (strain CBS 122712 / IBT 29274) TaxID=1448314 RepID=A0A317USV7_ASPEC|nr:lysosomal protective protein precursor [Aspergillus eucalypticola CBS 122712]PWY64376.1 lysosomal protective protein precursor [Aspergillus eucalypticola CBS 122712]